MAYFTNKEFSVLTNIGKDWKGLITQVQNDLKNNLNQLKALSNAINNSRAGFYSVPTLKPNSTPGKNVTSKVIRPWLSIFPSWMPNKTAGKYEICFMLSEDSQGLQLEIAYCLNTYKKGAPNTTILYNWQSKDVVSMNDAGLVNEIIDKCRNHEDTFIADGSKNGVQDCIQRLASFREPPLNQILYGPPGTGKTYHTVEKALEILDRNNLEIWKQQFTNHKELFKTMKKKFDELRDPQKGQIVFTTFHQSMSYEDFVEGIKPKTDPTTKQISYSVEPGIFKEICDRIIKDKQSFDNNSSQDEDGIIRVDGKTFEQIKKYVLIIDEINRGNVSQIFGEIITLLEKDKRLGEEFELTVRLPYSTNDFGVPANLYIIGTMNTADRSVEALDTALRRRFSFVEMMPKPELLSSNFFGLDLQQVLRSINERLVVLKDREHQIGHSYFMELNKSDKSLADLKAIFKEKIVPLLQEYFYGDYERIKLVLGDAFIKENNSVSFAVSSTYGFDQEHSKYRLLSDSEWDNLIIKDAIQGLLNK